MAGGGARESIALRFNLGLVPAPGAHPDHRDERAEQVSNDQQDPPLLRLAAEAFESGVPRRARRARVHRSRVLRGVAGWHRRG